MDKMQLGLVESRFADLVWQNAPIATKDLVAICEKELNWKRTTTYTVIKKLEAKGFIRREDPGFICTPLISQNQMQKVEATSLVKKVFGGSRKALFSALLEDEPLSDEEIDELRKLIANR
jgi:predicted transcriptional regulator